MRTWPKHPVIYEINTWVWLKELSRKGEATVDLSSVPSAEWDAIAAHGFDAVWLMGVWERSPAGISIANRNETLIMDFRRALPDFHPEDNSLLHSTLSRGPALGWPRRLGGCTQGTRQARNALDPGFRAKSCGARSSLGSRTSGVLHPGKCRREPKRPGVVCSSGQAVYACGKDPYFPAWPDVLQLNAFQPGLRRAAAETLLDIATQCDGVRCDMAMLLLNSVFERTWGDRVGPRPHAEYWADIISRQLSRHTSRFPLYRRGVLGPGVGVAATRIRLLLRQTTLRSPRA